MEEKYYLNVLTLFETFKKEYTENNFTRRQSLKEYASENLKKIKYKRLPLTPIIISVIFILFIVLLPSNIMNKEEKYLTVIFAILILVSYGIQGYLCHFSDINKEVASYIVFKILKENNINISISSIEVLIDYNNKIITWQNSNWFIQKLRTTIYSTLTVVGIALINYLKFDGGKLTVDIFKQLKDNPNVINSFFDLFLMLVVVFMIILMEIVFISKVFYCFYLDLRKDIRLWDLYIKVLEEMKFTLRISPSYYDDKKILFR